MHKSQAINTKSVWGGLAQQEPQSGQFTIENEMKTKTRFYQLAALVENPEKESKQQLFAFGVVAAGFIIQERYFHP